MRVPWTGIVGILITLLLLWWVLHDVSFPEVWHELRRAEWGWLLAAVAVVTLTFPLRTVRWRYLLRSEGVALPILPLWHATAIGFMTNNLLPARAGEVARAYAARQLTGVRFTTAFASVAVERIFDGILLVALLLAGIAAGGFSGAAHIGGVSVTRMAAWGGLFFGGLLLVALLIVWQPTAFIRLAERALRALFPERWAARGVSLLEGMLEGLSALRHPGRFAVVVFWSLVIWVTNAASFALAFLAFDLALPWGAAFVLQGVLGFGVAIPAAPGFFGVFEGATRASLALYGVGATQAVSLAIGFHIAGFAPITLLGLWSLWSANLHLRDLRKAGEMTGQTAGRRDGRTAE